MVELEVGAAGAADAGATEGEVVMGAAAAFDDSVAGVAAAGTADEDVAASADGSGVLTDEIAFGFCFGAAAASSDDFDPGEDGLASSFLRHIIISPSYSRTLRQAADVLKYFPGHYSTESIEAKEARVLK